MPRPPIERVTALEAAAALLDLAMRESHGPVELLGSAVERMTGALARHARVLERQRAVENAGNRREDEACLDDLAACQDAFEREIAVCIETLQFHDRLMQQLAQVRNCLATLHGAEGDGAEGDGSVRVGGESWVELRAMLWSRLTSDSQRALFDLLLPATAGHASGELRDINAHEGSIEIF
jgi:hypothetical protein